MEKQCEMKVYAVGTSKGGSVLFALVNGSKMVIPTDLRTMAKLAEMGMPVKNEN